MSYHIQKNVPMPAAKRRASPRKYPLDKMAVGDMFFVPHLEKNTLVTYISAAGRELGRKFTTRLVWMVKRKGQWVAATADTARAVRGVGVWRRA